jgi:hypothetical protein
MLMNLPKRGPRAYELFLECLDQTQQGHIKEIILNKEAELRYDKIPNNCNFDTGYFSLKDLDGNDTGGSLTYVPGYSCSFIRF